MMPLLNSIAMQQAIDFREIGVVIAYDGDEATPLPEEEWQQCFPFDIQFVRIPHGGVSAARNAALEAATADYVMFCDADDAFFHLCGIFMILQEIRRGEFDSMTTLFVEETRHPLTGETIFVNHECDNTFVHGKIHRRAYLNEQNIRFNPALTIHEDSYFNVLAKSLSPDPNRVKYLPTGFYLWRWRDNSVCRHDPKYMLKTYTKLVDSSDAMVDELDRRGRTDLSLFYVGFMLFSAYYETQKDQWHTVDHLDYLTQTERRLSEYLHKHRTEWDALPMQNRMEISNDLRTRYIREGMPMERLSFADWLEHITNIGD